MINFLQFLWKVTSTEPTTADNIVRAIYKLKLIMISLAYTRTRTKKAQNATFAIIVIRLVSLCVWSSIIAFM
jgi:hypothetical protein